MSELEPWMGHQPRDRGSVWYLGPRLGALGMLIVVGLAVAPLIAVAVAR